MVERANRKGKNREREIEEEFCVALMNINCSGLQGFIDGIRYGFEKAREQKTILKVNGGYFVNKYQLADEVINELNNEERNYL